MNRSKWIAVLIVGALLVAGVAGVFAYQSVSAATARLGVSSVTAHGAGGRGLGGGYTSEDLANALGISVDELTTAKEKARDSALEQAVQKGLITQAQADQIKSGSNAFPIGGRWMEWLSQNGIDFNALLAEALGISTEDLQVAYTKAYNARVDQAVTDGRITQEQADLMKGRYALFNSQSFQTSIQSAFEAAVRQAVTDGVITQAQADLILQNQNGMGFHGFGGFDGMEGFGGGHGGGRHGGWNGEVPSNPDSNAPTQAPSGGA